MRQNPEELAVPGFIRNCQTCSRRINPVPSDQLPCTAVSLDMELAFPGITADGDSLICDKYNPNLRTALKNTAGSLLRTIQLS